MNAAPAINPAEQRPESTAVLDLADLVRREGSRVYTSIEQDSAQGLYHAMLCGLTVTFGRGGVVRAMKSHDMELNIRMVQTAIEQDQGNDGSQPLARTLISIQYMRGNGDVLTLWHRHLCAYRQSMRTIAVQAPRENHHAA